MNKLLLSIGILATIFIMGFVSSQSIIITDEKIAPVKLNSCNELKIICANCTYVNITSIIYPNATRATINPISATTQFGSEWNATFCQNIMVGKYIVNGNSDIDGGFEGFTYDYIVNSLGLENQEVYTFILILIVSLLIGLGVYKRDITLTLLGTFGLYFLGIWILFYGFDVYKNYLTNGFAFIILGAAAYLSTIMAHEYIVD